MIPWLVAGRIASADPSEDEAETWVERGLAALAEGRSIDAIEASRAALSLDPERASAWDLHLRAFERAGAVALAREDVDWIVVRHGGSSDAPVVAAAALAAWEGSDEDLPTGTPPWLRASAVRIGGDPEAAWALLDGLPGVDERRERIAALVDQGRTAQALGEARRGLQEAPAHPEPILALWTATPDEGYRKARDKIARKAIGGVDRTDVLQLWRARRVAIRAGFADEAAALGRRLVGLGEPATTLDRAAWGPRMQQELGVALAHAGRRELPTCTAQEAVGVATGASATLVWEGRDELAAEMWATLWETVPTAEVGLGYGRALLAVDRPAEARIPLEIAARITAAPDPSDVFGLARDGRAQRTAAVLGALARSVEPDDPDAARRFATLAVALDPRGDHDAARTQPGPAPASEPLDDASFEHALRDLSRRAASDPAAAPALADRLLDAVCPASEPVEPCASLAAEVEAVRGAALAATGDQVGALAAYDRAILLVPRASWLVARGDLLATLGHPDAAFGAWSVAWTLGAPLPPGLESSWSGPSRWDVAARAARRIWDDAEPDRSGYDATPTPAFAGSIGDPLPDVSSCEVDGRPVGPLDVEGRGVVVAFWASWCGPCHDLFEALTASSAWSDRARLVAVSADDDARAFERGRSSLEIPAGALVCRAPALASTFGVRSLPTVWVFGVDGRAVGRVVGYSPGAADELRRLVESL